PDMERFDLIIRNATLVDGTGSPGYSGDLAVRADRIVHLGHLEPEARAGRELDARGLVAAPGIVDAQTHAAPLLLCEPAMAPKVSQGVTTVVTGNCGISLACSPLHGASIPPLDLLDGEGTWFRFLTFGGYRAALEGEPAAA